MSDATTVERLSKAIGQATKSAKFCVVGSLPVVDPGIELGLPQYARSGRNR